MYMYLPSLKCMQVYTCTCTYMVVTCMYVVKVAPYFVVRRLDELRKRVYTVICMSW